MNRQRVVFLFQRIVFCTSHSARRTLLGVMCILAAPAPAGQSLQPGVYYHEPSTISLSNVASGGVCTDENGIQTVCETAHKIYIRGEETCDWSPDQQYPCTRFGYEFSYSEAQSQTRLECKRRRYSPRTGEQNDTYEQAIDAESGRVFYSTFRTYAPVEERSILSEVHECSYAGELVATIEFIIYYEPGVGGPGSGDEADRYFVEVPNACSDPYLTDTTASALLRATGARRHAASEHVPILQSQCIYGAAGGQKGQVGYVFKFMLADMFDVDRLPAKQIEFNATFANGGTAPEETLESPGRKAFLFRKGDRATLFVITGIKGREDLAGRPTEFVAQYYIDHPDMDYASKQGALLEQARMHLQHWRQQ